MNDDIHNMTVEQYLQWFDTLQPQDIKKHFGNEFTPQEARQLTESLAQMINGEATILRPKEEKTEEQP